MLPQCAKVHVLLPLPKRKENSRLLVERRSRNSHSCIWKQYAECFKYFSQKLQLKYHLESKKAFFFYSQFLYKAHRFMKSSLQSPSFSTVDLSFTWFYYNQQVAALQLLVEQENRRHQWFLLHKCQITVFRSTSLVPPGNLFYLKKNKKSILGLEKCFV